MSNDMIGQMFGHFRIVDKVGEGGMGEVFVAQDTRLDRAVAIKVLSDRSPDDEQLLRFEREAKAAASLNHPNVVSIYDYGRREGMPYLVMELLEGQTLHEALREADLTTSEALALARQVVQGVAAAHDNGICHRDLKPANVFVTTDDRVKILDFGLAAVRDRQLDGALTISGYQKETLTTHGTILGSAGYMAPEQVRGEPADARSDIFALGSLFFELFSGKRAFRESTVVETLHAILKTEPPVAPLRSASIPDELIKLIYRCLEKQPEDRFQTARDLSFALQGLSNTGSAPGSGLRIDGPPASLAQSLGGKRSVAVLPLVNMSTDADTEYFSDGVTEDIISVLAQMTDLRVAARTSCFAFKGKNPDVTEVGAKLRVDHILEGSVRRVENRIRVTVQLISVADGYQLWSERYDRQLDDVFAIQDDIARNVANKLRVTLGAEGPDRVPSMAARSFAKPSTDMAAYDLYLKGRYHTEQRGEGIAKGLEFFKHAIEADPKYAPAYAATAESLSLLAIYSIGPAAELLPKAKAAAAQALELDESLPEAYNAMALVSLLYDWNWEATERHFDRALELNPSMVPSRFWKGLMYLHFVRGQTEDALKETLRAVALDPIATLPLYSAGLVLFGLERYDEVIERTREGLERDPTSLLLYRNLGFAYFGQKEYRQSIEALQQALTLSQRQPPCLADLGAVYAKSGHYGNAERLQEELLSRADYDYVSPATLSVIPGALGKMDQALDYLEQAFEQKDPVLIFTTAWPVVSAKIRNEPRVQNLYKLMGLNPERRHS